ncbi:MAG: thioester domain-containing protein [Clostridiales Family XIII bacterium]|jgi:hypothetical protein|nr:thioester domain-containing protein [Clostridiales Family XIII bacterium]
MKINNKGVLFSIVVVMLASVFTYGAYGAARGLAAGGDASVAVYAEDPDVFDAVVHYNDKIQITYLVMNKDGTFTQGPGDIQLGVLNAGDQTVIRQLYCAAATVHFHTSSIITHPSGEPYVDEANGYVIATPDRADVDSPDLSRNLKQVMWLVANGYYGDNTGLSVNNASVKDLEARYPAVGLSGSSNRAEIAVIATKIAIWHFSDPMVSILSTSLSMGDQIMMYNLVKALIADANAYAENSSSAPIGMQMNLKIDDSAAGFTTIAAVTDRYFYGPLTVISTDAAIQADMDKIFLSLSGYNHGAIDFVKDDNGSPGADLLDVATEYGYPDLTATDQFKAPYVEAGQTFWLSVPEIESYQDLSGINIDATARANGVTYTQATPQLVVYGAQSGAQDWEAIQSFVGLMEVGAKGNIYGQARLELHGGVGLPAGHVSATKIMLDVDGNITTPSAVETFTVKFTPENPPGNPEYTLVLNAANHWYASQEVNDGTYAVQEIAEPSQPYTFVEKSSERVTIEKTDAETSSAAVWVKNQEDSGKVIIHKIVRGADGGAVKPFDRDLFVVNLDGADKDVSVGFQNATVYSSGEIKLPVGEYKVSELYDSKYSRIDGSNTINIKSGETTTLDVINRQHEGAIKVKKIVKVNGKEVTPSPSAVYVVTIADEVNDGNKFTLTLDRSNNWEGTASGVPAGDYKVSETSGGEGWEISYSSSTVKVTDGSSHEITVTNAKTVKPDDDNDDDNDDDDDNNDDSDDDDDDSGGVADTGDHMPLGLWSLLLFVSGAGVIAIAILSRRLPTMAGRRRNRK